VLFLAIIGYFILSYLWLLLKKLVILSYFILGYFRLCDIIVGYFWLLKDISPYAIIRYSKLYYQRLFVVILLVVIGLVTIL